MSELYLNRNGPYCSIVHKTRTIESLRGPVHLMEWQLVWERDQDALRQKFFFRKET